VFENETSEKFDSLALIIFKHQKVIQIQVCRYIGS